MQQQLPLHDIYILYIHPELRIRSYRFQSGKGAKPLEREHRGSKGAQRGSIGGARGSAEGAEREHEAVQGRSRWEPEVSFLYLGLSCL